MAGPSLNKQHESASPESWVVIGMWLNRERVLRSQTFTLNNDQQCNRPAGSKVFVAFVLCPNVCCWFLARRKCLCFLSEFKLKFLCDSSVHVYGCEGQQEWTICAGFASNLDHLHAIGLQGQRIRWSNLESKIGHWIGGSGKWKTFGFRLLEWSGLQSVHWIPSGEFHGFASNVAFNSSLWAREFGRDLAENHDSVT